MLGLLCNQWLVNCALASNAMVAAKQLLEELKTKHKSKLSDPVVSQAITAYELLNEFPLGVLFSDALLLTLR